MMGSTILLLSIGLAPLSVLLPVVLSDKFSPGSRGDSSWVFIGPLVYVYGVIFASVLGGLGFISGLLLQSEAPELIGVTMVGGISLLVFCVMTVASGYEAYTERKKWKAARKRAEQYEESSGN